MIVSMYALLDCKVGAYQIPMFFINDEVAKRAMMSAVDQSYELAAHAEDYQLFKVAEWDDQTGEVIVIQPKVVCTIIEIKALNQAAAPVQINLDTAEATT